MPFTYQQPTTASATTVPAVTNPFPGTTSPGSLIAVAISNDSGVTGNVTAVTDNKGNTYTRAFVVASPALEVWSAVNTTGGAGHTVSVTWSLASASHCAVIAMEFLVTSGPPSLDVFKTAGGSGTAANSGASASTAGTDLVLAVTSGDSTTPSVITPAPATTFGPTTPGGSTDSNDSAHLNGSKITTGATAQWLSAISAYVAGPIGASPNDQFAVGIYTDNAGAPGTLVVNSSARTLVADAWNSAPISALLAANTSYWLMYNSNGAASTVNNLKYAAGGSSRSSTAGVAFGTWPSTFPASSAAALTFSINATLADYGNAVSVPAIGCSLAMASRTAPIGPQTAAMTLDRSQLWRCAVVAFKDATAQPPQAYRSAMFLAF